MNKKTGVTLASEVTVADIKQVIEESNRIDLIHRNHKAKAYSQKVALKQAIKGKIISALTLIIFFLLLLTVGKVSAEDTMDTYIRYGVLCNTSSIALNAGHKIIPTENVIIKGVNVGDNVTCTFNIDGELISVERR